MSVRRTAPLIRGVVEQADGVVDLLADRIEALPMRITAKSRDSSEPLGRSRAGAPATPRRRAPARIPADRR
jgi:hypothetical protein